MKYKKGFDKTFEDFFDEAIKNGESIKSAISSARYYLRMQADIFNTSIRADFIKEDSICALCGSNEKIQLDHILPISKGGKNEIENIRTLCKKCNGKQNKGLRNSASPFKRPYREIHLDTLEYEIKQIGTHKISITTTIEFDKVQCK